jgi:hypothetical protein
MSVVPLIVMTALIVAGALGTIGKLLFDDWRVRWMARMPEVLPPEKPTSYLDK